MKKVVLGFSGGVDSAVCSLLLKKEGYEVQGVYLDNAGPDALEAAVRGAEFSQIPLNVIDVKAELEEKVCTAFCRSYLQGETPNPCILCNPSLKFRHLLEEADRCGADYIATGHYAVTKALTGGGRSLHKGNPENDQSYMLCRLTREQLNRLILPIGFLPKREVRAIAAEAGLPAADKPDSMEICFIPDKDYIGWLGRRASLTGPGKLYLHGEVIGEHKGIHCYTVGQRLPGLYHDRKVYISRIDAETDRIQLSYWEELFATEVTAKDFNWLIEEPAGKLDQLSVRVRHTKWENPPCSAFSDGAYVHISCSDPVRAPAAGQSAVLYEGDRVLGGGFICNIPG